MSYTPTTWETGDTITAAGLNKIEQGIANAGGGGGGLIANVTYANSTYTMDKTFAEIYEAILDGIPCYIKFIAGTPSDLDSEYIYSDLLGLITLAYKYDASYKLYAVVGRDGYVQNTSYVGVPVVYAFTATQASAYPTFYRKTTVGTSYLTVTNDW